MGSPVWRWRRGLKPCPCSLSDSGDGDAEHCRKQQRFLLRCAAREGRKAQEAKAREKREMWPYGRGLGSPHRFVRQYVLSYGKAHVSRHQRGLRAKRNRRGNG